MFLNSWNKIIDMIKFGNTSLGFYISLFVLIFLTACTSKEQANQSGSTDGSSTMTLGNGEDNWIIPSPNKQIQFIIQNQSVEGKAPRLFYRVKFQDELVVEPSFMGLKRKDQSFGENLTFVGQTPMEVVASKANLLHGKRAYVSSQANEVQLTFKNAEGGKMEVIARAYNDGIAFRYRFPESSETTYTVEEELTSFDLPEKGRAWMHPYDSVGKYQPAYETYYEHNLQIGREADGRLNGWAFPALFNINQSKHWLLVSEAAVDGHYCGMHLQATATKGNYRLSLPLATEGEGQGAAQPSSTLPWTMPWRFITIGPNLATIVESDMVNILAPASELSDVSWVKPGISSWSWWSESNSPKNYNLSLIHISEPTRPY